MIRIGDKVKVKHSVTKPRNGWGAANHTSIGIVRSINGENLVIDFPRQKKWGGILCEMEHAEPNVRPTESSKSCDIFECPVCLDPLTDKVPRLLPCGHTFCESCLQKLIYCQRIKCPTCRKEVPLIHATDLPKNYWISQLQDREKKQEKELYSSCQICLRRKQINKATHKCNECFHLMCAHCMDMHANIESFKEHKVCSLMGDISTDRGTSVCKDHEAPVTHFCMECEVPLCLYCTFDVIHKDHGNKIKDVAQAVKMKKALISELVDKLKCTVLEVENKCQKTENGTGITDVAVNEITKQKEKLKLKLEREAEELISQLKQNTKQHIEKALEPLKAIKSEIVKHCEDLGLLENVTDCCDLLKRNQDVNKGKKLLAEASTLLDQPLLVPTYKPSIRTYDRLL